MTDFTIRPLVHGEQRAAFEVLGRALHAPRPTDEDWERRAAGFPADRKFGAFAGERLIGTAGSFGTRLAVPGGKTPPAAAVDGVAVRADHTRRGVLTALMREQLRDCLRREEVFAYLHASEATIYGRFGYGVATRGKTLRVHKGRARFRDDAPSGGQVRLLEPDEAHELLPGLYERIAPYRTGMIDRPDVWWQWAHRRLVDRHHVAVHTGPDGDDGFVLYRPEERRTFEQPEAGAALVVGELHATGTGALTGLWRYLLSVDLVAEVRAPMRPLDEPIGLLLTDPRACEVVGLEDSGWLRLVDVPAALAARTYGDADPVVLEVTDPVLPENSGRYRISPGGVERVEDAPDLRLGLTELAMLYLGDRAPRLLAETGRIEVLRPEALPAANALFATGSVPFCGTQF
ncbi:GNAT family N-acetyltransferase [Amycolatopsis sacchari]|uniref:GNAT family N-acetyltransferase n=1 Tax=Amycolatopsis sacchari TaxID=115433 RepID=UPI003EB8426F